MAFFRDRKMARGRTDDAPARALFAVHNVVFAVAAIVIAAALIVYFAVL
jgi:hypothetical protein